MWHKEMPASELMPTAKEPGTCSLGWAQGRGQQHWHPSSLPLSGALEQTQQVTSQKIREKAKMKGGLVYTMPGGPRARTPGQYFHSLLGTKSLVGAWQTGSQVLM